jgi:type VI secretion system secreted protein Hcp
MSTSDYLLVLNGIKGEAQDAQYTQAIEIDSWSFSAHNASTAAFGTGSGAGKVSLGDIQLSKKIVDIATCSLFKALCTGKVVADGVLHCRKKAGGDDGAAQVEYLKISLFNCTITSVSLGGHGSATGVSESISMSYEKIQFEYYGQKPDGSKGDYSSVSFDQKQYKAA